MKVKDKDIEVSISRRILRVGDQAYPLGMVTRVQPIEYVPNRSRIVRVYLSKAGSWIGLGLAGLMVLSCMGNSVPVSLPAAFALLVLAMIIAQTVQLVRRLSHPTVHVLSVATAGTAHAALASTSRNLIRDLANRVVDAIDNPAIEYAIRVDNIDIGDIIHGDKYGGDRIEGDKFVNGPRS